jgi:hypothetical protein
LGELVDRGAAFHLFVCLPHWLVLPVAHVSSYHHPDQLLVDTSSISLAIAALTSVTLRTQH